MTKPPSGFTKGVAKHEESRWRSATSLYLNPLNRTLLAEALRTGDFVTFEQMEPSLVRLETPQQVQLAYAEAASSVEFMLGRVGYPGLREIFLEMARTDTRGRQRLLSSRCWACRSRPSRRNGSSSCRAKQLTPVAGVQLARFKVVESNERDDRSIGAGSLAIGCGGAGSGARGSDASAQPLRRGGLLLRPGPQGEPRCTLRAE